MKLRILVIEDDLSLATLLQTVLEANGYQAVTSQSGRLGYALVASYSPDAIILNLGLPDVDGMQIIYELRKWSEIPIVVTAGRRSEQEVVEALDAGADDYLAKPFGMAELMARLRAAIRHASYRMRSQSTPQSGNINIRGLSIDTERHIVMVDGNDVHLTQNEFRIVMLLARHAGHVLTHEFMKQELWGPMAADSNQILRVHMANIRRKLEKNPAEPEYILTEVGIGYYMADGRERPC